MGLNSGQVIAGEIGSGSYGYTAIGEQVGMAQRMESVAPPGGVMLSAPGPGSPAAISRAQASRWAASGGRCADGGKCADSRDFDAIRLGPGAVALTNSTMPA